MNPKNIFLALEDGSLEQQKKRRAVVFAMLITAAALVLSLVIFLISGVVSLISDNAPDKDGEEGGTDISTYEPTSFSSEQVSNGNLLLVDDNHSYKGNTSMVTFKDSADRPRKPNSNAVIYSLNTNLPYGGTAEAVSAFNAMIKDFYEAKDDDNLYIENSCNIGSTAQENIFATGLCFELTYYVNWETERDNRPSIYGVEMYQWIYENAHKYGFIQLYSAEEDASKANIFRYVGEAHAFYIKKQNISFSEYIALVQTKTAQAPLTVTTASKTKYNIYYIAKDAEQLVPTDSPYTVSGDNLGGYIVTVKMS